MVPEPTLHTAVEGPQVQPKPVADLKKALTAAKALTAVSTEYLAEAKQAGKEQAKLAKEVNKLQAANDPKKQADLVAVSQTEQNISDVITYKNFSAYKNALDALEALRGAVGKLEVDENGELKVDEKTNPKVLADQIIAQIMTTVPDASKTQISKNRNVLIDVITKIQLRLKAEVRTVAAAEGAPEQRTVTEQRLNDQYCKEGRGVNLLNKASIFFTKQVDKVVEYALKGTTMYSGPFKTTVIQLVAAALMKIAEARNLNVVSFGRVEIQPDHNDNWPTLMENAGFDRTTTYDQFRAAVAGRRTILLCTNMEALEAMAAAEPKGETQGPVTRLLADINADSKIDPRMTMCASTSDLAKIRTANATGMKTYDLDSVSNKEIIRRMDQYHGDHVMHAGKGDKKRDDGTPQTTTAWFDLSDKDKKKFANLVVKATGGHPMRVNMFIDAANEAKNLDEVVDKYNEKIRDKYGNEPDPSLLVTVKALESWKFPKFAFTKK